MLVLRAAGVLLATAAMVQAAVFPRAGVCGGTDRGYIDAGTVCKPCGLNNRANGNGGNGCSPCYIGGQLLASTPYPAGVPFAADPAYPGGTGCFCNSDKGLFGDKCKMCVGLGRLNGAFPSNACGRCITSATDPKYIDPVDGSCKSIAGPCANPVTQQGNTIGLTPSPSSSAFFVEYPQGTTATACCQKCYSTAGCVGWVKPLTGDTEFGAAYAGGYCLLGMNTSPSLFSAKECGLEGNRIVTPSPLSPARYEIQIGPCGRVGTPTCPLNQVTAWPAGPGSSAACTPCSTLNRADSGSGNACGGCKAEGATLGVSGVCSCAVNSEVHENKCKTCLSLAKVDSNQAGSCGACTVRDALVDPVTGVCACTAASAPSNGVCTPLCSIEGQTYSSETSSCQCPAGQAVYGSACAQCPSDAQPVGSGSAATCRCSATQYFVPATATAPGSCSPCSIADSTTVNRLSGDGTSCRATCPAGSTVVTVGGVETCKCPTTKEFFTPGQDGATGTCSPCANSLDGNGTTCGTSCGADSSVVAPNAAGDACACVNKQQSYNDSTGVCSNCPSNSLNGDGRTCGTQCNTSAQVAQPNADKSACVCTYKIQSYNPANKRCTTCPNNSLSDGVTCTTSCGSDANIARPFQTTNGNYACGCLDRQTTWDPASQSCKPCPANSLNGNFITCGASCGSDPATVAPNSAKNACVCAAPNNFIDAAGSTCAACPENTATGDGRSCGAPCPDNASLATYTPAGSTVPVRVCRCQDPTLTFTLGANLQTIGTCTLKTASANGGFDSGYDSPGFGGSQCGGCGSVKEASANNIPTSPPYITGKAFLCAPPYESIVNQNCNICPYLLIDPYHSKVDFTVNISFGYYGGTGTPRLATTILGYEFNSVVTSVSPPVRQKVGGSVPINMGVLGQQNLSYNVPAGTAGMDFCLFVPAQTWVDNIVVTYV